MARDINIGDNILDTRDIIKKFGEVKSDWQSMVYEAVEEAREAAEKAGAEFDEEKAAAEFTDKMVKCGNETLLDFRMWKDICEELEHNVSDWRHGAILIHEDHFQDYAKELAEDLGYMKKAQEWPYRHIDWEAAADELKSDYTTYELNGETYYASS